MQQLASEIRAAVRSLEVSTLVQSRGFQPVGSEPGEFANYVAKELAKYERVVKDSQIKAD